MTDDKTTIGLTEPSRVVCDLIIADREWFESQLDAAKFALSIAIDRGTVPGEIENTGTVWNIGSFDPNGELRELMRILYPEIDTPSRLLEYLVNRGLNIIGERLKRNPNIEIAELMRSSEQPT